MEEKKHNTEKKTSNSIKIPIKKTNSVESNLNDPFNNSPPNMFLNNLEKRYLFYYNTPLSCATK